MSDIKVGHEEGNIACTVVLLKAMVHAGVTPVPLAVELTGGSEEGWRRAAINHLDMGTGEAGRARKRSKEREEGLFQEFNEELDWHESRERNR
jgi:hypothetical protein